MRSQEDCAIYMNGADLTIKHCTVNAIGAGYGIAGSDGSKELLSIERARVTAEGTEKGSIMDIAGLSLKECTIVEPAGAKFDKTKCAVVLNGELVKSKIVIEPTITSILRIAGVEVTSANCDDLSVLPSVSGTVKYDPVTNVLTLKDAKITAEKGHSAIESQTEDLEIKVIGTNDLNAKKTTISTGTRMKITGNGLLNVKSQTTNAVYINGTILEIIYCTVNAIGKECGITGLRNTNARLYINNAEVEAEGSEASIYGLSDLKLQYSYIVQPKGAAFDASLEGVAQNGKLVTEKILILPHYCKLVIAGKQVTFDNYYDLSTINGVSGTVKYDPITKVLTLQDAKISAEGEANAILSESDGITINVIGTNEVNTENIAIFLSKPLTITGGGTLNVNAQGYAAIYTFGGTLTIDGCTVNA